MLRLTSSSTRFAVTNDQVLAITKVKAKSEPVTFENFVITNAQQKIKELMKLTSGYSVYLLLRLTSSLTGLIRRGLICAMVALVDALAAGAAAARRSRQLGLLLCRGGTRVQVALCRVGKVETRDHRMCTTAHLPMAALAMASARPLTRTCSSWVEARPCRARPLARAEHSAQAFQRLPTHVLREYVCLLAESVD